MKIDFYKEKRNRKLGNEFLERDKGKERRMRRDGKREEEDENVFNM